MRDNTFSKKVFIKTVSDNLKNKYRKTIDDATQQELYQAVSEAVKDVIMDEWIATQRVMDKDDPKVVYYMSMEFLMGRALGNNLINLSAYKEVKEALDEIGVDINAIEDQEPDPALGNGGLGRLAACFMDSLATLGYPAYGCGIRYRYGMFKQQISDGFQIEVPDNWLKDGYPFELRRPEYCYEVKFGGYVQESTDENGELHFEQKDYQSVLAVPYDMPIVGYDNNVVNSLMIWDAEPKNGFSLESFDQGDYDKAVEQENLAKVACECLNLDCPEPDLADWKQMVEDLRHPDKEVKIALVGKYTALHDAYISVVEALKHGGIPEHTTVDIKWVDSEELNDDNAAEVFKGIQGIIVPGGFGDRGVEGMIAAAKYARENNIPYLGLCLGMQVAIIEYARHVCMFHDAHSIELDPNTTHPVIALMPDQNGIEDIGGTLRLGSYPCVLDKTSKAYQVYGTENISERHRHRYEVNNDYRTALTEHGMKLCGTSPDGRIVEMIEIPEHPWFIATQAHPELKSRPNRPHPLFHGFIEAANKVNR